MAFVNELSAAGVPVLTMDRDALRSYYVDYYYDQVANGGFSQVVYNSRWGRPLVDLLREGLAAIGAARHGALVERGDGLVAALGPARLDAFLRGAYFGANPERDDLAVLDDEFAAAVDEEDLVTRNAAWLLALPKLHLIPQCEFAAAADRYAAASRG